MATVLLYIASDFLIHYSNIHVALIAGSIYMIINQKSHLFDNIWLGSLLKMSKVNKEMTPSPTIQNLLSRRLTPSNPLKRNHFPFGLYTSLRLNGFGRNAFEWSIEAKRSSKHGLKAYLIPHEDGLIETRKQEQNRVSQHEVFQF